MYEVEDIEEVEDIKALPQDILKAVKPGDVVRVEDSTAYIVGYKDNESIYFLTFDEAGANIYMYALDGEEWVFGEENVKYWNTQADWSETNAASSSFIRNKPAVPQGALIIGGSYTGGDNPYIVVDSTTTIKNAMEQGRAVFIQCSIDSEEIYASVIFGSGANCYTITEGKICTIHD